ncbi:MAG: ABC transporter permease, partial [Alphaproteobacteria bacterium]|nr:ABC transporter permease [Alphaproteobacteria bacterium]
MSSKRIPHWADVTLVPLVSVVLAFVISAILIWAIGESPWDAVKMMVDGAFGSSYGWGYTL